MPYDFLVIAAHPDDAEVQMGGTIAKLTRAGKRALIVDLCDGEPADFAPPGVRREQAQRAARILGADRLILDQQDRLIVDNIPTRLALARLVREHRPKMVFATTDACVHPDHAAVESLVTAGVFTHASRIGTACREGKLSAGRNRGKSRACSFRTARWNPHGALLPLRST